jgi:collagenase-like PrtC family protease
MAVDFNQLIEELKKVGNRGYTTGFIAGELPQEEYIMTRTKPSHVRRFWGYSGQRRKLFQNSDEVQNEPQ